MKLHLILSYWKTPGSWKNYRCHEKNLNSNSVTPRRIFNMNRILILICMAVLMTGCSTAKKDKKYPSDPPKVMSPATMSELEQGKRLFQDGYYKRAMQQLLPIAVDGNAEAQYAVGYMYYYGYGTTQDTASGDFWIRRSAE